MTERGAPRQFAPRAPRLFRADPDFLPLRAQRFAEEIKKSLCCCFCFYLKRWAAPLAVCSALNSSAILCDLCGEQ